MESEKINPAIDKMVIFFLPFQVAVPLFFWGLLQDRRKLWKHFPPCIMLDMGAKHIVVRWQHSASKQLPSPHFPAVLLLSQCQPSADLWHMKMVWTPKGNERVRGGAILLLSWVVWAGAQRVVPSEQFCPSWPMSNWSAIVALHFHLVHSNQHKNTL